MKSALKIAEVADVSINEDMQRGALSALDALFEELDRANTGDLPSFTDGVLLILGLLDDKNNSNITQETDSVRYVLTRCREVADLLVVLGGKFSREHIQLLLMSSEKISHEIRLRIHEHLYVVIEWNKTWFDVFPTDDPLYDPYDEDEARERSSKSPHGRRRRTRLWWKTALKDVDLILAAQGLQKKSQ